MMKHQRVDGFTLLEMLVSIAIIAIVSVVLSQVFISTLRSNTKAEILKEVKQNGDLAVESITRMIQNAADAWCPSASSFSTLNPDGEVTTIACEDTASGARLASQSAAQTVYLTSTRVSLGTTCAGSQLSVTCEGAAGIPTTISVSFQLSQSGTVGDQFERASQTFRTSVSMRNITAQ